MDTRDRRAVRAEAAPARRAGSVLATATILVVTLVCGCGTQPVPSPTPNPTATPAATATPAPTPTPTPAYADTLRVGWSGAPIRDSLGGWGDFNQIYLGSAVYGYLYGYDAQFSPVPDLADGPCFVPGAEGWVIRCRLIKATFQDDTPLTADDVAYSYRLFGRPTFVSNGVWVSYGAGNLKEVRVVDPRTVDFVLSSVDATFLTDVLPALPIVPQHAVEASYAAFLAGAKDLRAKDLTALADAIDQETGRTPPVCTTRLDAVKALLDKIGYRLYREDYRQADGTFDPCAYMAAASGLIRQAAKALGLTGLDAVATAYTLLSIDQQPISTGPYRFVSEDANGIHLEAWPGYRGGLAATRYLDFVPAKEDGSDLVAGTADIFQYANPSAAFKLTAAAHGVQVVTTPQAGFYALYFNVRPGRPFADIALRRALQLCIDLPRNVDTVTLGTGIPIYGPVLPGTWAYDPDLPKPARDTYAARSLIEAAGWQLGSDGVYAKGEVRLAAQIVVRPDDTRRVKMADLIALQARDCGMDLASRPADFWGEIIPMLNNYPHDIPGTKTPFDLYIGGLASSVEPADGLLPFLSSQIPSTKNPGGYNFSGFSDPLVDRLDAAGKATYDQAERAKFYRQEQEEIAAQVPALFLWADKSYDLVRSAVTTVDGPLDLTVPHWSWQLSRMVVAAASP